MVDSSVAVAAFAPWHESHEPALAAVAERPHIVGHAALETYSVLTRLPPPHRVPSVVARDYVGATYRDRVLGLPADTMLSLLDELSSVGITGGAAYDGLIAATVRQAEATLLTLDRRAVAVYQSLGTAHRVLA